MRHSVARLSGSPIRLSELSFPHKRVHVSRTRLTFIHLDNLLHFAKIDRDGRVDGFVAAYLPDEVVLLFLRNGELITAASMAEAGREVLSIATALKRIRQEMERGELEYADAPMEQLGWMYESCAAPAAPRFVDPNRPEDFFPVLAHEKFTGVLELMSGGRVNYFRFQDGRFADGHFDSPASDQPIGQYVAGLFAPLADGHPPAIAAATFPPRAEVPEQAPPLLIQTYREIFWAIAAAAEREVPQEAMRRAYEIRDLLSGVHRPLLTLGTPLDREAEDLVATPQELTYALSDWTLQLLEQLEVIAPGIAPDLLKNATHQHRFVLQKAGFYGRLPWAPRW